MYTVPVFLGRLHSFRVTDVLSRVTRRQLDGGEIMAKIRADKGSLAVIIAVAIIAFIVILALSVGIGWMLTCLSTAKDLPAWVQAVGAILTIVTGFATLYYQRGEEAKDQLELKATNARVALLIAAQAMTTLGERLDALLAPNRDKHPYRLRGARSSEMIASLRELDTTRILPNLLEKFLQLRSNFYALNERISEIYESEKPSNPDPRERSERLGRLAGGLEIWRSSRTLLQEIRMALIDAGQSDLAMEPATFAFEATAIASPAESP
jgi:hypothetical protein